MNWFLLIFITNIYYILIGITFYSLYFIFKTFIHCLNLENTCKILPNPGLLVSKTTLLWVYWFLGKNLSNFVPPIWKLHNTYCRNWGTMGPNTFIKLDNFFRRTVLINFYRHPKAFHYSQHILDWSLFSFSFSF